MPPSRPRIRDTVPGHPRTVAWFVFCSALAVAYFAREVLTPIALAAYVAFVLAPPVRALTRRRVPRMLSTSLVLGGAAIAITALGWVFVGQARSFADNLPEYRANLRAKLVDIRSVYGGPLEQASSTVRELGGVLTTQATDTPAAAQPAPHPVDAGSSIVTDLIGSVATLAAVAGLVFVLSWIMLFRWDDLRDRMLGLVGSSDLFRTTRASVEASSKVSAYVRKQIFVNGLHGTVLSLLLVWIGVPNPLVWGILAGLSRFLPYVGPVISTLSPILVSLASSAGWARTWEATAALLSLELLTNTVVEPWIYGACTGVSPLALLVSAGFWTWLWGPAGLVLSTPLTVCLLVAGKHFPGLQFLEVLVGDQPAMPERSRLFHRLLLCNHEDARDILRNHISRERGPSAADELVLSALVLAGQAVRDGKIDAEQRQRIATLAHTLVGELEELRREPATVARRAGPSILCVTARDALDAIGSRLLAAELERRGFPVSTTGDGQLLAETLDRIRTNPPSVVCVSSVAPTHFLHVRTLCKRLLEADSETPIVLGLWHEELDRAEIELRLPASDRVLVVTSLAEAVERAAVLANTSALAHALTTKAD